MNRQRTISITIIAVLIMLILSACGTAGPASVNINADATLSAEKSAPEIQDSNQDSESAAAEIEPVSEPANAVMIIGESEFDGNGIEIGFTESGHAYRGNPEAPVVLEEFSDFQCPYCSRWTTDTLPSLLENQIAAGEVLLIYYDFPLESIHPQAFAAANAARCAGEQSASAYWDMHDQLYNKVQNWSGRFDPNPTFISFAEELGLDIPSFTTCVEETQHESAIQDDIDLALSRGVRSTPSFFLNGEALVGAQPLEVFNQAIASIQNGESLATAEEQSPTTGGALPLTPPRVAPTPAAIIESDAGGVLGDADAPVTIVEFSDYQCPYCERHFQETLPLIISEMIDAGKIRYIFKDLPLDGLHPEARSAALAARCAGEQDAYWEMHDALFSSQQEWAGKGEGARDVYISFAADLGLNEADFTACYDEDRYGDVIQANVDEAQSLGASATPYFFIDGFPIAGAQSFELFYYAVGLAEVDLLADAYDPGAPDLTDVYSVGDPNAPVTIIEYTDYQCPYCSRHFENTYGQIKENFIDKGLVYYVFKDFPLTNIHPQAQLAAVAARCAGDQGAYPEMHDKLFSSQAEWQGQSDAQALFSSYAAELNLDSSQFASCLTSGEHDEAIQKDMEEGAKLGVSGTPSFVINGYSMSGAQPYQIFEQAINQFLEG